MIVLHIARDSILWLRNFFGNAIVLCTLIAAALFIGERIAYRRKRKDRCGSQ